LGKLHKTQDTSCSWFISRWDHFSKHRIICLGLQQLFFF
jgi:hypothetical protein